MIRVLELFAGIGACSKALTNLGIEHEIVDAVEIDKYAVKSFNAIHGTNFEPQDVTKWDKDIECDLIMHGSPCQDFSVAGKGAGGDKDSGTRSSLMYETLRIVEKLKPKYVIWENVKNLLSKKHRHNFDAYLDAMTGLGYANNYQVLNAKDYGIPQNRERVFTVSIRRDIYKGYFFPAPIPLEKRLKDVLENDVDEKYYLSDERVAGLVASTEKERAKGNGFKFEPIKKGKIAHAISTKAGGRKTDNYVAEPTIVAQRGRSNGDWHESEHFQQFEPRNDGLTNTLSSVQKDNYVAEPTPLQRKVCNEAIARGLVEPNDAVEYTYSNARLKEIDNSIVEEQTKALPVKRRRSEYGKMVRKQYDNHELPHDESMREYYLDENGIMSALTVNGREQKVAEPLSTRGRDVLGALRASMYKQGSRNLMQNVENGRGYDMAVDGDEIDLGYPQSNTRRGRVGHGVAKTILTSDSQGTLDGFRIRKLTPKECWRLMGFSDDDFKKAQSAGISNSQLYKQAGNSIVVNVLEGILRNLLINQ